MITIKRTYGIVIAALFILLPANVMSFDFEFLGLRTYTLFGFLPAPTGADARINFTGTGLFLPHPATISVTIGGGYEAEEIYRNADGGNRDLIGDESEVTIDRFEVFVEPGFTQRLSDKALIDLYFGIRTYFRENLPSSAVFTSTAYYLDEVRILANTLRTGVRYEAVDTDRPHGDAVGIDTGAMVEWTPSFLGNRLGGAEFLQLNATFRWYLPLFDLAPERVMNLFNAMIAQQASIDWITGNVVPIHAQANIGGFFEKEGLGGIVRGFEKNEKSALFKTVLNTEIRILGPAVGLPTIFPVLVAFFDAGYYSGFKAAGYFRPPSDIETEPKNGIIASVGATLSVSALGFTYIGYTIAFPVAGRRADGASIATNLAIGMQF